jgi:putative toxin-antitoxin system antitoxin component (TIGR02293 family)
MSGDTMTASRGPELEPAEGAEIQRVAQLFGGPKVLRHKLRDPFDAHEALKEGLPGAAVTHLIGQVHNILGVPDDVLHAAIGMSVRTVQRLKRTPRKRLSRAQSGQVWNFARILAKATDVLGSREAAEQWLARPAMALDRRQPIELLGTAAGIQLVEDLLGRIEYGVYT